MKIEARFCKKGVLRNISHLDIVRLFQRAVRRAGLPVGLSQGYNPHYKISFGNALKLGMESDGEEVTFAMNEWMAPEEFEKKINEKLPEGIKVLECKKRF
ncbi:MAG: TIGR03936 family radical SAM-associated protein [Candidatus Omnitrophica bacterium]|nr:TIGR03936 family radical SAM-associated protein [Candidatus Omnitrophota bacterium]MBU4590038.1 TIGR03936 family radical SAM-associated protein [Candidatus Omnitrophota bacterium]